MTGSAGSSVAEHAGNLVAWNAECLAAGGSGSEGIRNSSIVVGCVPCGLTARYVLFCILIWVCQGIVTGSAGSSVAWGAGNLVAWNALCLAAGGSGSEGIRNSSIVVALCLVVDYMVCSAGVTEHFVVVGLANHHPSPLLYFYKWGNLVTIHISLFI